MDQIVGMLQGISNEDRTSADVKSSLCRLVEIRGDDWKMSDAETPTTFVVPESKPTKKGSNAIAIVQVSSPFDIITTRIHIICLQPPSEPVRNNKTTTAEAKNNAINATGGQLAPEDQELTEEELRFMSEQMGEDALSDVGLEGNGDNDAMPDEVEAAYQQFLDEQQNGSKS